jgi:hypothetical protein
VQLFVSGRTNHNDFVTTGTRLSGVAGDAWRVREKGASRGDPARLNPQHPDPEQS